MYNPAQFGKESFEKLNKMIKEIIDEYYAHHDAEQFFQIVSILEACKINEWTIEEIPQLIEMQNIIVMG